MFRQNLLLIPLLILTASGCRMSIARHGHDACGSYCGCDPCQPQPGSGFGRQCNCRACRRQSHAGTRRALFSVGTWDHSAGCEAAGCDGASCGCSSCGEGLIQSFSGPAYIDSPQGMMSAPVPGSGCGCGEQPLMQMPPAAAYPGSVSEPNVLPAPPANGHLPEKSAAEQFDAPQPEPAKDELAPMAAPTDDFSPGQDTAPPADAPVDPASWEVPSLPPLK